MRAKYLRRSELPRKLCAICTMQSVRVRDTFCPGCKEEWASQIGAPWVLAAIKFAKDEYNQLIRELFWKVGALDDGETVVLPSGKTIPLEDLTSNHSLMDEILRRL